MTTMAARWQQLGNRAEPHLHRTLFTTVAIGGYVALLSVLVLVPLAVASLGSAAWLGRVGADQALHLTLAGRVVLALIAAAAFCLSITAGGFAKVAFHRTFVGHLVLFVLGVALAFPIILTARAVVDVASDIASAPVGDNVAAAGVLLFWVLMVNNAAKPIWDEARDRVATWIGHHVGRFVIWFGRDAAPADSGGTPQ